MMSEQSVLKGVIHGRQIELDQDSGWPDGQEVTVLVIPALPRGEGIRQSAGGWADAGAELDLWLEEMRRSREYERAEA